MWDHSTFSFNRQRLFDEAIAQHFLEHMVLLASLRERQGTSPSPETVPLPTAKAADKPHRVTTAWPNYDFN